MAASITDAGPLIDTLDTALSELNSDFLDEFGTGPQGIDTSPKNYTGRQNNILAARDVALQLLLLELSSLLNLDNAQGRFLDFIGTVLSEARRPAQRATISARLYGFPGFDAGDRRVRYLRTDTIWRAPIGTTIGGNGSVDVTLFADQAGETTTDGLPVVAYADGTDQWVIIDSDVRFTAVESLADSSDGENVEGDPDYRSRLRVAGRGSGYGTEPGVLRALQRVAGASADIDNNRGLTANANGVDGKAIEALVAGGTDEEIAQAIYDSYSDTAGFFGSTTALAVDPNGNEVPVRFTRIESILIEWDVSITTAGAEAELPDDAESIVQTALADYTNGLAFGIDVQPEEGAAVIRESLPKGSIPPGGLTVDVGLKGGVLAAVPVVITSRQRARTDPEPQSAEVLGTNAQPFNIVAGQVLGLAVDNGTAQEVVFQVSDFAVISAATALELATAINSRTSGIVAGSQDGALVIRSETTGSSSSLEITTGSTAALLTTLGLSFTTVFGSDGDIAVTIT
jgi:hypothetical protein